MAKAQSKDKEAKAAAKQARKKASKERRQQLWQAFQMQRKEDKRLLPYMIGLFVVVVAVFVGLGFAFGSLWLFLPLGTPAAEARGLRAAGWVTVAALEPGDTPEAQLATHCWTGGEPRPL